MIDFKTLVSVEKITDQLYWELSDAREVSSAIEMTTKAERWLQSHAWVNGIERTLVGMAIPGVVGVFLLKITRSDSSVDEWNWVVIGDLPSAYISPEFASNPQEALECYVEEMQAWVDAVRSGRSVDELIPVDAPPDTAYAAALETRLTFLRRKVIGSA